MKHIVPRKRAPRGKAPAPVPAPAPAHPLTRLKEFCNNPATSLLLPHFQRWEILPQFPSNVLIYNNIIDLTRIKAYHRPMITNEGRSKRADYFLDASGNETPLKKISTILFFFAEMVYIHASISNTPYLIATPTRILTDTHKITSIMSKAITGAMPASVPLTMNQQIHWIYMSSAAAESVQCAATWLELNPAYTLHVWLIDDNTSIQSELAKYTNIKIHDPADFRATIFSWLEDHLSLWAEEMFITLWENRQDPNAQRLISAYARNILLATQGGFYADCDSTVCLAPLSETLDPPVNFMAAADTDTADTLGTYFMGAPIVGDHDAWNDVVVKSVETILDAYRPVYDADHIATHVDTMIYKSHLPRLHCKLELPITLVPYSNLQQGCLLSIIGHVEEPIIQALVGVASDEQQSLLPS